jgi:hypothetical protein
MISRLFSTAAQRTKLLVLHLPSDFSELQLQALIKKEKADIEITKKYTHITLESESDAKEVHDMLDGYKLDNTILKVRFVVEERAEEPAPKRKEREQRVTHLIETFHIRRDFMPYVKRSNE